MEPEAKIALVTGASSGIGRSIARALADRGHRVFGTTRDPSRSEPDRSTELLPLDVRREDSVRACVAEVLRRAGRVDVLVNAAGYGLSGSVEETSLEQARRLFETNFFGLMAMTAAVLPDMRARGSGAVVNVGSVLGLFAPPFLGVYAATKHAVEAYSEALHHEVGPLGVRVILVEPGFTRTRLGLSAERAPRTVPDYDGPRERAFGVVAARLQGGIEPEAVAATVVAALQARRHRLRHPAGREASTLALLRRLVPASAFARSLRKQFHVDGAAGGPGRREEERS
jgi:short-subunit dehydrogenase